MKIKSVVGLNLKRTNHQKIFMVGLETISRGDHYKKLIFICLFILFFLIFILFRFRRDFRLAGVRNNEEGNYLLPDMPDVPPGYPDLAPEGFDSSKFKRVDTEDLVEPKMDR